MAKEGRSGVSKIARDLSELIGETPLLALRKFSQEHNLATNIVAKLEYFNPLGSSKDRLGYALLADAEKKGLLTPASVIIEPTSGNTGIALAMMAAIKGYRLLLTMPETMSAERKKLLKALGAEIVLTPGAEGMAGAVRRAAVLAREIDGSFLPGQFTNPVNVAIHKETTGPEIWRDTAGEIDVFVAGVGTGGTLSGVGEYLKAQNPAVKVVAVEPAGSPVLSGGKAGNHHLEGLGAGFIPEILNRELLDEVIAVQDEAAVAVCRFLAKKEGLLVGISSGAALQGALQIAQRTEYQGKLIVVLLADAGERYLSTTLFA